MGSARTRLILALILTATTSAAMAGDKLSAVKTDPEKHTKPPLIKPLDGSTIKFPAKLKVPVPVIDPKKMPVIHAKPPDETESPPAKTTTAPPADKTPVKLPTSDGPTPPPSGSYVVTPPGEVDGDGKPGKPEPVDTPIRDSARGGTYGSSASPTDVGVREVPAPDSPRVPTSSGTLLGAAIPGFDAGGSGSDEGGSGEGPDYEPGQLVFLTPDLEGARQVATLIAGHGYRLRSRTRLTELGMVLNVVNLPPDVDVVQAVSLFEESFPGIVVDANHRYRLQQGSSRSYARQLIGWAAAETCLVGARIGMIDTNVDGDDPLLQGVSLTRLEVMPAGLPRADPSHGVAVAALLSGIEYMGFAGLARHSDLFAVDVFRESDDGRSESLVEWIVRAMDLLAAHRVDVVNMSLGGAHNRILERAVGALLERGIPIVAAAGNGGRDGDPAYPAAYSGVIAVTAVDAAKRVYGQASSGDHIDFAAPGVDIFVPAGSGGSYRTGTSYAAPFVSAAVAEIRARHRDLPIDRIHAHLVNLSEDLGRPGRDDVYGWGLPDFTGHCTSVAVLDSG